MSEKEEILEILKEQYDNPDIQWPSEINVSNIQIDEINKKIKSVTLTLCKAAAGLTKKPINMQKDSACFEGWAVALKATNEHIDIYLDVKGSVSKFNKKFNLDKADNEKLSGHYGRFLYRVLRFSQQYGWFHLCGDDGNSETLKGAVNQFEKFLKEKKFENNVPEKEAGTKNMPENIAEEYMASNKGKSYFLDCLGAKCDDAQNVYRQLPVGLFLDKKSNDTRIFTGGTSAIDLWTMNGDVLQVVELKTDNKMVGIVTEIFFYSNYIHDFLINTDVEKGFQLREPPRFRKSEKHRGYDTLYEKRSEIKKIEGFMLADVYHPLITSRVLDVLNAGSKKDEIKYFRAEYDQTKINGHDDIAAFLKKV